MIQNEIDKILVDNAIDATRKQTFQSEVNLLKANPAYQNLPEEEIEKIALENCKSKFEMLQEQRKIIKPINPIQG
jgi:hypothetical protein